MKEFLKKELYSFRAVAAILARWLLLAVPTGLVCGAVGGSVFEQRNDLSAFHSVCSPFRYKMKKTALFSLKVQGEQAVL